MSLKVSLLSGRKGNKDKVLSVFKNILREGVINGGLVTTNSVAPGEFLIKVTRTNTTPNETFFVYVEITTAETIDTSGSKKVWLEIAQAKINSTELNATDGTGVAELKTGASYPSSGVYYIPLASITGGSITDARNYSGVRIGEITELINPLFLQAVASDKAKFIDSTGAYAKLDALEILLSGNAVNTANGLLKLNASGLIDPALL